MSDKRHSMPNLPDLDAAIDRAVRDLLNAEPRAGMRQRVLDRLNAHQPQTWAGMLTLPRLAAVAALAVLVVIAASVAVRRHPAPEMTIARPQPVAPVGQPRAPQTASITPEPRSTGAGTTPPKLTPKPTRSSRSVVAAAAARSDRRVEAASVRDAAELESSRTTPAQPLPAIPPIGIDAIDVPAIVTPEITIKPLTVQPIPAPPVRTPR
jgi:hypothetical protein